ncbi:MAG TPA: hypothetical protein VF821_33900, partial [Lentzea sp.]
LSSRGVLADVEFKVVATKPGSPSKVGVAGVSVDNAYLVRMRESSAEQLLGPLPEPLVQAVADFTAASKEWTNAVGTLEGALSADANADVTAQRTAVDDARTAWWQAMREYHRQLRLAQAPGPVTALELALAQEIQPVTGVLRPLPAPAFLTGFDQNAMAPDAQTSFFESLDLLRPAPADVVAPASRPGSVFSDSGRDLPKIVHVPVLGGPVDDSAWASLAVTAETARREGWTPVLVTDVPRSMFVAARAGDPQLADLTRMDQQARQHGFLVVGVDEVFNADSPMVAQDLFSAAHDNMTDENRDLARAVLGAELTRRFGGVVVSAEYALTDTGTFTAAVSSEYGFALGDPPATDVPPVLVVPRGHQFADLYTQQLGDLVRTARPGNANTAAMDAAARLGPIPVIQDAAEFRGEPEDTGTPTLADLVDLVGSVVETLTRGLRARGDLDFAVVDRKLRDHPHGALVLEAAVATIAREQALRDLVQTVTIPDRAPGARDVSADAVKWLDIAPDAQATGRGLTSAAGFHVDEVSVPDPETERTTREAAAVLTVKIQQGGPSTGPDVDLAVEIRDALRDGLENRDGVLALDTAVELASRHEQPGVVLRAAVSAIAADPGDAGRVRKVAMPPAADGSPIKDVLDLLIFPESVLDQAEGPHPVVLAPAPEVAPQLPGSVTFKSYGFTGDATQPSTEVREALELQAEQLAEAIVARHRLGLAQPDVVVEGGGTELGEERRTTVAALLEVAVDRQLELVQHDVDPSARITRDDVRLTIRTSDDDAHRTNSVRVVVDGTTAAPARPVVVAPAVVVEVGEDGEIADDSQVDAFFHDLASAGPHPRVVVRGGGEQGGTLRQKVVAGLKAAFAQVANRFNDVTIREEAGDGPVTVQVDRTQTRSSRFTTALKAVFGGNGFRGVGTNGKTFYFTAADVQVVPLVHNGQTIGAVFPSDRQGVTATEHATFSTEFAERAGKEMLSQVYTVGDGVSLEQAVEQGLAEESPWRNERYRPLFVDAHGADGFVAVRLKTGETVSLTPDAFAELTARTAPIRDAVRQNPDSPVVLLICEALQGAATAVSRELVALGTQVHVYATGGDVHLHQDGQLGTEGGRFTRVDAGTPPSAPRTKPRTITPESSRTQTRSGGGTSASSVVANPLPSRERGSLDAVPEPLIFVTSPEGVEAPATTFESKPVTVPDHVRDSRALGLVKATQATKTGAQVAGLVSTVLNAEVDGLQAIATMVDTDSEFESFLGDGREFQVKVGERWYAATVVAELDVPQQPMSEEGVSARHKADLSGLDPKSVSASSTIATGGDVGATAAFTSGVGPTGTIGVRVPLGAPAVSQSHSTGVQTFRGLFPGETASQTVVPVKWSVTVVDARLQPVGENSLRHNVTLSVPDKQNSLPEGTDTSRRPIRPDATPKLITLLGEAVTRVQDRFADVAAMMHPSITKVGAPGRTALKTFLSAVNIRAELPSMIDSWVSSADLVSPHGSHGAAVRMKAVITEAELLDDYDDTTLALHDASTRGVTNTPTSKKGFSVSGSFGGGATTGAVGGAALLGASVGVSTSESTPAGAQGKHEIGTDVKGRTGAYAVKAVVTVQSAEGQEVDVEVDAVIRLSLAEAAKHGFAVPAGFDGTEVQQPADGKQRFLPPYLAYDLATGNAKIGRFDQIDRVKQQIEDTLSSIEGFEEFLPTWGSRREHKPWYRVDLTGVKAQIATALSGVYGGFENALRKMAEAKSRPGDDYARFAEMMTNQRMLDTNLSPGATKSQMDSLFGKNLPIVFKRRGFFSNDYVRVTVKAKLNDTEYDGEVVDRV